MDHIPTTSDVIQAAMAQIESQDFRPNGVYFICDDRGDLMGLYNYRRLPRKLKKWQKKNNIWAPRRIERLPLNLLYKKDETINHELSRFQWPTREPVIPVRFIDWPLPQIRFELATRRVVLWPILPADFS